MAEKLPSGSYRTRVTYTDAFGKQHRVSFTADTAREADYKATEFKLGLERTSVAGNITFYDAAREFLDYNSAVLSPSTLRGYTTALNVWTEPIHSVPLQRLSGLVLQKWINLMVKDGKSPKTCHNAFGFVSAVASAHGVELGKVNLPPNRKKEMEIPQREEVEAILSEAEGHPEWIGYALAADCGMRRSEICGLTWDSIDLGKRKIHITEAIVISPDGEEVRKTTKTASGVRTLDMTNRIYDYFLHADKCQPPVTVSVNQLTKNFLRINRKLGMDYHLHTLRHYFCSVCCALNLPENYTVRLMGHASNDMVHKVYCHCLDEAEQHFRGQLLDFLNG